MKTAMLKASLLALFLAPSIVSASDTRQNNFEAIHGLERGALPLQSRYIELSGLEGQQLFEKLHELTGQNYKTHDYRPAKRHMYDAVDNKDRKVFAAYSNLFIPKSGNRYLEEGDSNGDGVPSDFVNCEHVWPQSKFLKKKPMVSDLHHLLPTLSKPNNVRSSFPFGRVKNASYRTTAGAEFDGYVFEPPHYLKGNVARAMLYFVVRYHDRLIFHNTDKHGFFNSRVQMFMKWHREDPPDEWEKERNNRIERWQGNRNPFIDEPELVDKIGSEPFIQRYVHMDRMTFEQLQ